MLTPGAPSAERGGDPAAIGDTPGRDYGDIPGKIDDLGDQHHRRHPSAVAACFTALREEHIGASLERPRRGLGVGHGLQPEDSSVVGAGDQIGRNPHVKRDRGRGGIEGGSKCSFVEGTSGVIDREWPVSARPDVRPLLLQFGNTQNVSDRSVLL
jgi:hypothetical protein